MKPFRILMREYHGKEAVMSLFYKKFSTLKAATVCLKELETDSLWSGYEMWVIKMTDVSTYNDIVRTA
jgi:hypothetical protein